MGGQEASMGRERLTAKDIERERQMELEQVSGGIKEREIDRRRWRDYVLLSAVFCKCEFEDERSVSFTVQKLTAGIEEQQVCELIAGSFFRLSLSQGRMCIGWSQLKINSCMSLGLILELKGPSLKAATSQDASQSEW